MGSIRKKRKMYYFRYYDFILRPLNSGHGDRIELSSPKEPRITILKEVKIKGINWGVEEKLCIVMVGQ